MIKTEGEVIEQIWTPSSSYNLSFVTFLLEMNWRSQEEPENDRESSQKHWGRQIMKYTKANNYIWLIQWTW